MSHPTAQANAEPIPGYRLIERLGRGGYGEVWKCEAPGGMHKAVKFVFGDMDSAGDDGKAAEQEFKSLARVKTIRHPFLLSLERIEVIAGQLLIVMELADRNLADRFNECVREGEPGIPRHELLKYMEEAAEALDLMNVEHQIQHLDIKPQNLFLVHRHVKVADFGLAKDLEGARADLTGGITPMYAPPETFNGWVSRQSDQYSLAIVYMEMLTGKRPFTGANTRQLIFQHLTAEPDLTPLADGDKAAVGRALSKNPEGRFASCADFVRALQGSEARDSTRLPRVVASAEPRPVAERPAERSTPITPRSMPAGVTHRMPALVTQRSRGLASAGNSTVRKGVTSLIQPAKGRVERTGAGCLEPTLIVGVGEMGLAVLREARRMIAARHERPTLPHLRWLFIDTDAVAAESAATGTDALTPDEILLARLKRPPHYLSREGLPEVDRWLPSAELFRLPKSLATEGSRKIGRLALCDHYQLVCQRLRTSMTPLLAPAALDDAARITGSELMTSSLRVMIVSSLTGGTGSGMAIDLAYLARRELSRLGLANPNVTALLGVPTAAAVGRDPLGQSNAHAALLEIDFLSRGGYESAFDVQEGAITDPAPPFRRSVLFSMPPRGNPASFGRAATSAAHLLTTEMLNPVGRVVRDEMPSGISAVGMQRVFWPRARLRSLAAVGLARKTLEAWSVKADDGAHRPTADLKWNERGFDPRSVQDLIHAHVANALESDPEKRLAQTLRPVVETPTPSAARQVLKQLIGLIGKPVDPDIDAPPLFIASVTARAQELGHAIVGKVSSFVMSLVEQPGLRLDAAEAVIRQARRAAGESLATAEGEAKRLEDLSLALFAPLGQQLLSATSETWRGKSGVILDWHDALAKWSIARWRSVLHRSVAGVYQSVLGCLSELVHEVSVVRNQLVTFAGELDAVLPAAAATDDVVRRVLPDGATTEAEAAGRLVDSIPPADLRDFENSLQARIRHECRGITGVCSRPAEMGPVFLRVLLDQAERFVEPRLKPVSSLVDLTAGDEESDPLTELLLAATPSELPGTSALTIWAAPDSLTELTDHVADHCRGHTFKVLPSTDEILLWRENAVPVDQLLAALPSVPSEAGGVPVSHHSRMDIAWPVLEPA